MGRWKCVKCGEAFQYESKEPTTLGCSHIFCSSCVVQIEDYKCPICSQVFTTEIEKLTKNDIIFASIQPQPTQTYLCNDCDAPTTTYCKKCNLDQPLCKRCFKLVHVTPKKKSHSLSKFEDNKQIELICEEHKKPLDIFCVDCSSLICYFCEKFASHKGHQVSLPADVLDAIKKNCSILAKTASDKKVSWNKELLKMRSDLQKMEINLARLRMMREDLKTATTMKNEIQFLHYYAKSVNAMKYLEISVPDLVKPDLVYFTFSPFISAS